MGKIINTIYGKVEGIEEEEYFVFKGIPFAKPPVGNLRFKAPVKPDNFNDIYKADTFKSRSIQGDQKEGSFYYKEFYSNKEFFPSCSEDCLYLNIWTPKDANNAPVAIWFHGGAFSSGFSSELEFDGKEFAKKGVILVTANYRLGFLGFFTHPELDKLNGNSGNYGTLDQIASINYVKENISVFGGDPNNITIFGQSAGAMSVKTLLSSPLVKDKIQGAIIQSGGGMDVLSLKAKKEDVGKIYEAYMKKHKITLEYLQNCPVEELKKISSKMILPLIFKAKQMLPFFPVIDGIVYEDSFENNVLDNKLPNIKYMIGSCKDDLMGGKNIKKDKMYNSIVKLNDILKGQGRTSYQYYFKRDLPGDKHGAFHSAELWYMFGTLNRCWRPMTNKDYELSKIMVDDWTSFIKNGKPNYEAYPFIKEYDI